jgi:hypothetical protein
LVLAERLGLDEVVAHAMVTKATALGRLGRRRESQALVEGGLRLSQETGQIKLELRARNNLAAALGSDDVQQAGKIVREGLELAEKVGDRQMALFMASGVAGNLWLAGDWDTALALVDRHLERDLEPFDRINLGQPRAWILAERGESVDAEFEALEELTTGASDTQLRAGMEMTRAAIALSRRECDNAFEAAMRVIEIEPGFVGWASDLACQAALGMRDLERVRAVAARQAELSSPGRLTEINASTIAAVLAALEGRTSDAVRGYREVIGFWRATEQFYLVAQRGLDFVSAVGPDVPEARAAGEEAREIFAQLGARPALERLDALLGEQEMAGAFAEAASLERD